jgi:hypothetical protein
MHLWIVIAAFVLAVAAPFMDPDPGDGATFVQQDGTDGDDAPESDEEEV